jgi:hypothetical protein
MRRLVALTAGLVAALAACSNPSSGDWTGGPATPSPVPITANPSALPVGNTVPTDIVIDGQELVLYFWGDRDRPNLTSVWRHRDTGKVDLDHRFSGGSVGAFFANKPGQFFEMNQLVVGDGQLVEFGAVWAEATRITCQDGGTTVEARYAPWNVNPSYTLFWLRRHGDPIPANTPAEEGVWRPLAPERYPLLTAYGRDGKVVATDRLRPDAFEQKGG